MNRFSKISCLSVLITVIAFSGICMAADSRFQALISSPQVNAVLASLERQGYSLNHLTVVRGNGSRFMLEAANFGGAESLQFCVSASENSAQVLTRPKPVSLHVDCAKAAPETVSAAPARSWALDDLAQMTVTADFACLAKYHERNGFPRMQAVTLVEPGRGCDPNTAPSQIVNCYDFGRTYLLYFMNASGDEFANDSFRVEVTGTRTAPKSFNFTSWGLPDGC